MKVVILAGGFGTRLAEETVVRPKPMVEIGGKPILWHIMKQYAYFGFNEFIIALGYKGETIKDFFMNYHFLSNSFTVNTKSGEIIEQSEVKDNWIVHLIDTGLETMTGGRIKRLTKWLADETFMMTYGDGVSNLNLKDLLRFHRSHGKMATVTAIRPPARYGGLVFNGDKVMEFTEKPKIGEGWVSGGFFVLEPEVLEYIDGDDTHWESEPLERLAKEGQLMGYRYEGFWQNMDTIRDLQYLRKLWDEGKAAWKLGED
jgi:glucose-1-phosphate cytidylyltransferase